MSNIALLVLLKCWDYGLIAPWRQERLHSDQPVTSTQLQLHPDVSAANRASAEALEQQFGLFQQHVHNQLGELRYLPEHKLRLLHREVKLCIPMWLLSVVVVDARVNRDARRSKQPEQQQPAFGCS